MMNFLQERCALHHQQMTELSHTFSRQCSETRRVISELQQQVNTAVMSWLYMLIIIEHSMLLMHITLLKTEK